MAGKTDGVPLVAPDELDDGLEPAVLTNAPLFVTFPPPPVVRPSAQGKRKAPNADAAKDKQIVRADLPH
jgi:hypothetical protein